MMPESDWSTAGYDDSNWLQTALFNGFKGKLKAFVDLQFRFVLNLLINQSEQLFMYSE
jgi:hypothetical protein